MLATVLAHREAGLPSAWQPRKRPRKQNQTATQTAASVSFSIQNNTLSDTVYAFVTGQALDNGGALMLLEADGQTPYYPASPSAAGSPLAVDCAIPLNASGGAPVTITVPRLAGARLWFSIGTPLTFLLNPGPGLVEPSVTNPSDPNIDLQWDFCEFTYNDRAVRQHLLRRFRVHPHRADPDRHLGRHAKRGRPPVRRTRHDLRRAHRPGRADGNAWTDLIVTSGGQNLRALSPANAAVLNPSFLSGYFDDYVSQVWQLYESATLTVDTQASYGAVTGQVSDGLLTFPGVGAFAQPATADILSCATGPFSTGRRERGGARDHPPAGRRLQPQHPPHRLRPARR